MVNLNSVMDGQLDNYCFLLEDFVWLMLLSILKTLLLLEEQGVIGSFQALNGNKTNLESGFTVYFANLAQVFELNLAKYTKVARIWAHENEVTGDKRRNPKIREILIPFLLCD